MDITLGAIYRNYKGGLFRVLLVAYYNDIEYVVYKELKENGKNLIIPLHGEDGFLTTVDDVLKFKKIF